MTSSVREDRTTFINTQNHNRSISVTEWGVDSSIGLVRKENQDSWGQSNEQLFVVADGMGGTPGGADASRLAVEGLIAADPRIGWMKVLEGLNKAVRDGSAELGLPRAGTTLVAIAVEPRRVFTLHVGDSRIYRLRGTALQQLTTDHSLRELRIEEGKVADEPDSRGSLHAITSFIGSRQLRQRMDVGTISIEPGDRLLLCSDGIHNAMPTPLLNHLLSDGTCAEAASRLVETAELNGGRDNATALIVDLDVR